MYFADLQQNSWELEFSKINCETPLSNQIKPNQTKPKMRYRITSNVKFAQFAQCRNVVQNRNSIACQIQHFQIFHVFQVLCGEQNNVIL